MATGLQIRRAKTGTIIAILSTILIISKDDEAEANKSEG